MFVALPERGLDLEFPDDATDMEIEEFLSREYPLQQPKKKGVLAAIGGHLAETGGAVEGVVDAAGGTPIIKPAEIPRAAANLAAEAYLFKPRLVMEAMVGAAQGPGDIGGVPAPMPTDPGPARRAGEVIRESIEGAKEHALNLFAGSPVSLEGMSLEGDPGYKREPGEFEAALGAGVAKPFELFAKANEEVTRVTGSPALGSAVEYGLLMAIPGVARKIGWLADKAREGSEAKIAAQVMEEMKKGDREITQILDDMVAKEKPEAAREPAEVKREAPPASEPIPEKVPPAAPVLDVEAARLAKARGQATVAAKSLNITAEAVPAKTSGRMSWIHEAPEETRRLYTEEVYRGVGDSIMGHLLRGSQGKYTQREGAGSFEGAINPNIITSIARDTRQARKLADAYAKAWGYVTTQEGVPWYRPDYNLPTGKAFSVGVSVRAKDPNGSIPENAIDAFRASLSQHAPGIDFTYIDGEFHVVNFRDQGTGKPFGMPDREFTAAVRAAARDFASKAAIDTEDVLFRAESKYHYNDWGTDKDGQAHLEGLGEAYGPDLLDRLRGERAKVDEIDRRFTEQYGPKTEPPGGAAAEAGAREAEGVEGLISKAAKPVDEYIEESIPPAGLSVKDIGKAKPASDEIAPGARLASASAEVEKRWKASQGIKGPAFGDRVLIAANKVYTSFRRHFPKLDPQTDGGAIDILRRFEAIPEYSKVATYQVLKGFLAGFGAKKYDLFSRNVILPDMLKDIDRGRYKGKELPFGYRNREEVAVDLKNFASLVDSTPDVKDALIRRTEFMDSLRNRLVEGGLLPEEVLKDPRYFHHQVLEYMAAKDIANTGISSGDVRLHGKGWQKKRGGRSLDYNTEYLESEFEVTSQAIGQLETAKALHELKQFDISDRLKGGKIPEDYTTWQPERGNKLYLTHTLTEKMLDRLAAHTREVERWEEGGKVGYGLIGQGAEPKEIRKVIAVGGKKQEWVIPKRLAETLDKFREFPDDGPVGAATRTMMSTWKQWTLLNPYRVIKYNINNMSGDFDVVWAYNPKILKHAIPAARELWAVQKGKAPSTTLVRAMREAVVGSGLSIAEIPDIKEAGLFRLLAGDKPGLVSKYWKTVSDFTNLRENILRYAAYKWFLEEGARGRKHYGASKPAEIDAIKDPSHLAAKLARELVGDYGNVSQSGQWIRSNLIPFYSWMEINAPRYVRLFRNAPLEGKSRAGAAAGATVATGKKVAGLAARAFVLFSLVNLWNRTMFPDEEKELGAAQRGQLHLILGRNDEGEVRSLRFQGALSDALSWFGAENFPEDIRQVAEGESSVGEKALEAVKAPINKLWQGLRPEKSVIETIGGRTSYPDVFSPRPIKDKAEAVSKTLSLDDLYRHITGKPTRGIGASVKNLATYTSTPGETAYNESRELVYKFLKENGIDVPSTAPTKRSLALYYYRQAIKFKDEKAKEKYFQEYLDLGGHKSDVRASLKRAHPTSPIPAKLKSKFMETLKPGQRKTLERATEWYEKNLRD